MKNIKTFDTAAQMMSAYTGSEYVEPWVSYARQEEEVKYNRDYDIIGHNTDPNQGLVTDFSRVTCSDLNDHDNVFSILFNGQECTGVFCNIGSGSKWNVLISGTQQSAGILIGCDNNTGYAILAYEEK